MQPRGGVKLPGSETNDGETEDAETSEEQEKTEEQEKLGEQEKPEETDKSENPEEADKSEEPEEADKPEEPIAEDKEQEEESDLDVNETAEAVESEINKDENSNTELEVGNLFTVEYTNYTLGFTVAQDVNDWYVNVTSCTDNGEVTSYEVTIPSFITVDEDSDNPQELPVREIAASTFKDNVKINKLLFEENPQIVKINKAAFSGCTKLAYAEFPDTITTIAGQAFSNNTLLGTQDRDGNPVDRAEMSLDLPSNLQTIGEEAFKGCNNLAIIRIPKTLNKVSLIYAYANHGPFSECKGVKRVIMEDGMETIPENLFRGSMGTGAGTVDFQIPDSVTTIESSAFYGQTNLVSFQLGENSNLAKIGSYAFCECTALEDVSMPNSLKTIGSNVFDSCKALKSVELPDSVTSIGDSAFWKCTALQSIRIPAKVTTLGSRFCEGDKNLTEVILSSDTQLASIESWAFKDCSKLQSFVFPNTLKSISTYAFQNCDSLEWLVIPESVTSISREAFNGCDALKSVEFEVNNFYTKEQTIGVEVFKNCTSLRTVKLGNKIKTIPESAFSGCTALEELEIPYGVTTINKNVFYNCHALKNLFIPSSVTSIKTTQSELAFCYEQGLKIYVEKGESSALTWADGNEFKTEVGIYSTKDEFPDNALFSEMNTQRFDKNLDTRLTLRELEEITELDLSGLAIADMTGIQLMTFAESLDCSGNKLTALDTSALTSLKTLNCADNRISNLDLSKNPLETLNCENNALLVIDLSGIATLKNVTVGRQAGSLAVQYESAYDEYVLPLQEAYSAYNKACISELSDEDVRKPESYGLVWYEAYDVPDSMSYKYTTGCGSESETVTADVTVTITNAGITLTDKEYPDAVFRAKVMEQVDANQNGLISKTEERSCSTLRISEADIIDLTGLKRLRSLRTLDCSGNYLKTLDISNNPLLEELDCSRNGLKELNTQSNASLKTLKCADNKITKLNISQNVLLEELECGNNKIAAIDIANNQNIDILRSGNQNITILKVAEGDITYLDLKSYDESLDYEKVTNLTAYKDDAAITDADVRISDEKIVVPDDVEQISYKYNIPDFREMNVAVDIVDSESDLEDEDDDNPGGGDNPGGDDNPGDDDEQAGLVVKLEKPEEEHVYTGSAIQPEIIVTNNGKPLDEGVDYTVKYSNNIKVTEKGAKITVSGKGNFTGNATLTFKISPQKLSDDSVKAGAVVVVKNSKAAPVLIYNGMKLGTRDYKFRNPSDARKKFAADGTITLEGQNNFTGERTIQVKVVENKKDLKKFKATVNKVDYAYGDGKAHDADVTVKDAATGQNLTPELDFTIVYSTADRDNAGKVKFMIVGLGEYAGTVAKSFAVKPRKTAMTAELKDKNKVYTFNSAGVTLGNDLVVKDAALDNKELVLGKDYKVTYSNNKKASAGKSQAKYTVSFMGNYKGSRAVKGIFTIKAAVLSNDTAGLKIAAADKTYNKPGLYKSAPYVTIGGVALKSSDYKAEYYLDEEMTKPMKGKDKVTVAEGASSATVYVKITGKGNYAPADANTYASTTYKVCRVGQEQQDLSKARVTVLDKNGTKQTKAEYTGLEVKPAVKVEIKVGNDWKVVESADYKVTYVNNVNKGKATVIVTADSDKYVSSKTAAFSIVARKLK